MTEKEKFQRAFAPLHTSPDTMTEVMKMTEQKRNKSALHRAGTLGLAAALVLALGSVAYAADFGGIQRTVQLWFKGDQTDAVITVDQGKYTILYAGEDGAEREMGGGGIAGTERPLTEEELLEHLNQPEVIYQDDGTVMLYYRGQSLDITDRFDENGVCHVLLRDEADGERTLFITINYKDGYSYNSTKYEDPSDHR